MLFNRRLDHQLYFYLVTVLLFCFITKTCQTREIRVNREAILYSTIFNNNNGSSEDFEDDDFVPYQAERSNVFDWNLFKVLNNKEPGNILVSPLSVKMALILLYEGAQGQTAYELANAMQLPVSPSSTRDKFSSIIKSLQTTRPEYKLNIGTRLYIDQNIWIRQRYEAIVKTFYGVDVVNTNLSDVHTTADGINSWVRNVTLGNIDKMIDDEDSLKDTVMVVLNALFFKGSWRPHTFSRNDTRMGKFHTKSGQTVEVPYMNSVGRFFICESDSNQLDAKILRLPYQGHKYAMYIILPRAKDGLDRVIKEINQFTLARHIWLMQESPVDVSIPKFKFDSTNHLKPALQELGIESVFDDTATLTGIARTRRSSQRLTVSDVLQKTGIEVNEEGTKAYAATEILIANKIEDETFHARHPFLFFIEDESTGTILYIGKVTNPLERSGTWKLDLPPRIQEGSSTSSIPMNSTTVSSVVPSSEDRYNFFNIDLLKEVLKENQQGNIIISPSSVKVALTTLIEGTHGPSREQILLTLRLPQEESLIRSICKDALKSLKSSKNGTEIDVITRLWVGSNLKVLPYYTNTIQQHYGTDLKIVDFTNLKNSTTIINEWGRLVTRNKIKSIVDSNNLSPSTRILLTSALYFKGRWLKAFDKKATHPRCFKIPSGECRSVYMMENHGVYRYAYIPALDAEVVEIPYSDNKTSMLIMLPTREDTDKNLQIFAKDLSFITTSTLMKTLKETEMQLSIPKFSVESKLDLRPTLEEMGIRDIFNLNADLSGIAVEGGLRVGNILQNAKIEVDEDGTVAAAVTNIGVVPLMGSILPNFKANRPFLYSIVDLETYGILFAGRYMEPTIHDLVSPPS